MQQADRQTDRWTKKVTHSGGFPTLKLNLISIFFQLVTLTKNLQYSQILVHWQNSPEILDS